MGVKNIVRAWRRGHEVIATLVRVAIDTLATDGLIDELRRLGYRVTTARRAVLNSLLGSSGHHTADQIAHEVQAWYPHIDSSTVYRTLNLFEDLGIVEHAHLGHGPAMYHLGKTHQHLVCEACGAVIDVPIGTLDDLARTLQDEYGFTLHAGHFARHGSLRRSRVSTGSGTVGAVDMSRIRR